MELFLAFGAGLISFLSPCVLPLIPGYISYISNSSYNEMIEKKHINLFPLVFYIIWLFLILGLVPLRGETNSLQAIAQTADPLATLFGTFQQSTSMHYIGKVWL